MTGGAAGVVGAAAPARVGKDRMGIMDGSGREVAAEAIPEGGGVFSAFADGFGGDDGGALGKAAAEGDAGGIPGGFLEIGKAGEVHEGLQAVQEGVFLRGESRQGDGCHDAAGGPLDGFHAGLQSKGGEGVGFRRQGHGGAVSGACDELRHGIEPNGDKGGGDGEILHAGGGGDGWPRPTVSGLQKLSALPPDGAAAAGGGPVLERGVGGERSHAGGEADGGGFLGIGGASCLPCGAKVLGLAGAILNPPGQLISEVSHEGIGGDAEAAGGKGDGVGMSAELAAEADERGVWRVAARGGEWEALHECDEGRCRADPRDRPSAMGG